MIKILSFLACEKNCLECLSLENCSLCDTDYYIFGPQKSCIKCDGPNKRINRAICEEIISDCEDYSSNDCKKCKEGFFLNEENNKCEEKIYLTPVLELTKWRKVYYLNFHLECQNFLETLVGSPGIFSFFLNQVKLNQSKTNFTIQEEGKGILIGIDINQNYSRGSEFTLKIIPVDWMTTKYNKILKNFDFSIKLLNDYIYCEPHEYFNESNSIYLIFLRKLKKLNFNHIKFRK
jgi:hypothetical protein